MKHDFENAQRGAVLESTGKTRVTMYLDDDVIEFFRARATEKGRGYQTEINASLRREMSARNLDRLREEVSRATVDFISIESLASEVRGLRMSFDALAETDVVLIAHPDRGNVGEEDQILETGVEKGGSRRRIVIHAHTGS